MEFVATREALLATLTLAERCSDPKAAMPKLTNVRLSASADGVVRAHTTDLVRAYLGSFRGEVKRSGAVALHAKGLTQMVSGFPAKSEITVHVEQNLTTKLTAKKTRAQIAGADPDDFPSEPEFARDRGVAMPAEALLAALTQVEPFVAHDDARPHLSSACFTGTHLVSTNGHAMAVAPSPRPTPKILVPWPTIETWCAALRGVEGDVTLYATTPTALAALETSDGFFVTKLVDASFPSWEQVIPRDPPWAIETDAGEIRAAVRGMPTGEKTSAVKLSVQRDGMLDELCITGEDIVALRTKAASVSAKVLRGREAIPSAWGASLNYLRAALAPATGAVVIEGHGELDSFKVSAPGVEGYFAVVMPTRVS